MSVGRGTHGGIAHGSCVEGKKRVLSEAQIVDRGQLHEEVVRMLAVIDGLAVRRLALLEKLRIALSGDGSRLQAQHGAQGDRPRPSCRWAMGMNQLVEKTLS